MSITVLSALIFLPPVKQVSCDWHIRVLWIHFYFLLTSAKDPQFFFSISSRLFVVVIGPDIALVLEFVQMQVNSSVTLLIIFIPKVSY